MKISELIEALKVIQENEGDMDIYITEASAKTQELLLESDVHCDTGDSYLLF